MEAVCLRVELVYPWALVVGYTGPIHIRLRATRTTRQEPSAGLDGAGRNWAAAGAIGAAGAYDARGGTGTSTGRAALWYQHPRGATCWTGRGDCMVTLQELNDVELLDNGSIELTYRAPAVGHGVAWIQIHGGDGMSDWRAEPVPVLVLRPCHHAIQSEVCLTLRDKQPPAPAQLASVFEAVDYVLEYNGLSVQSLSEQLKMAVTHGWEALIVVISNKLRSQQELSRLFMLADQGPLSLLSRAVMSGNDKVIAKFLRSAPHDPLEIRPQSGFSTLHWAAALGPDCLQEAWIARGLDVVGKWDSFGAGPPNSGVTPQQLHTARVDPDGPTLAVELLPNPCFWQIARNRLSLQMGHTSRSEHWQMLRDEVLALNAVPNPCPEEEADLKGSGRWDALPTPPLDSGQDNSMSLDEAVHLSMVTVPCLLPLVLHSFEAEMGDWLLLALLAMCLLAPLALSVHVVLPAVQRKRSRLLKQLCRLAADCGLVLGAHFRFEDPSIQLEYVTYCLTGGSLLWDNLTTCGKVVATWIPGVLFHDEDIKGNFWSTAHSLGGQFAALAIARGALVYFLGARWTRMINVMMVPLCGALLPLQLRCWKLLDMPPVLSALPCQLELPSSMRGSFGVIRSLQVFLTPSIFALSMASMFSLLFPRVPSEVHLCQSFPQIAVWPALACTMAENGLCGLRENAARLLVFHTGGSFVINVSSVLISCFLWRRRERSLINGFLVSRQFPGSVTSS